MGVSGEMVTKCKKIQAVIFKISSPWGRQETQGVRVKSKSFFCVGQICPILCPTDLEKICKLGHEALRHDLWHGVGQGSQKRITQKFIGMADTSRIRQDIKICDIPNFAIFVGANGSGKSTLFDVFGFFWRV